MVDRDGRFPSPSSRKGEGLPPPQFPRLFKTRGR